MHIYLIVLVDFHVLENKCKLLIENLNLNFFYNVPKCWVKYKKTFREISYGFDRNFFGINACYYNTWGIG